MTTTDPNIKRLTALNGYLEFLLSKYPAPEGEDESEDPLILVLICMQKALERRIAKIAPTAEWVRIMRWAVGTANQLLDKIYDEEFEAVADWHPLTTPRNMVQNLCAALMDIGHQLIGDVAEAEEALEAEREHQTKIERQRT